MYNVEHKVEHRITHIQADKLKYPTDKSSRF